MATEASSVNVRVAKQTRQQLVNLARENGLPMQTILDRAVEAYRRQAFIEALNSDFAALKEKPQDWAEEMEERKLWEQTLADGSEQV